MATKAEKTILGELLEEVRGNRSVREEHGKVLVRLDERTLAMKDRIDETTSGLHGRIDGVEARVEARTVRKSTTLAMILAAVIGPALAFALAAFGWPRG